MSTHRTEVEINAARRRQKASEFRQHLVNASNELYLHEMLCAEHGRPVPPSLRRAHATIRAELKRLSADAEEAPASP